MSQSREIKHNAFIAVLALTNLGPKVWLQSHIYLIEQHLMYQKRERKKGGWAKTAEINESKNVARNGCSHRSESSVIRHLHPPISMNQSQDTT